MSRNTTSSEQDADGVSSPVSVVKRASRASVGKTNVQVRVWWPPTTDESKTEYAGMYWPARVVQKLLGKYLVEYDNGEQEKVDVDCVSPADCPVEFGEEKEKFQPGEFVEVFNNSDTDPAAWIARVSEVHESTLTVEFPFHDSKPDPVKLDLVRRARVYEAHAGRWMVIRPFQEWDDGEISSPLELELIDEKTLHAALSRGPPKTRSMPPADDDGSAASHEPPTKRARTTTKESASVVKPSAAGSDAPHGSSSNEQVRPLVNEPAQSSKPRRARANAAARKPPVPVHPPVPAPAAAAAAAAVRPQLPTTGVQNSLVIIQALPPARPGLPPSFVAAPLPLALALAPLLRPQAGGLSQLNAASILAAAQQAGNTAAGVQPNLLSALSSLQSNPLGLAAGLNQAAAGAQNVPLLASLMGQLAAAQARPTMAAATASAPLAATTQAAPGVVGVAPHAAMCTAAAAAPDPAPQPVDDLQRQISYRDLVAPQPPVQHVSSDPAVATAPEPELPKPAKTAYQAYMERHAQGVLQQLGPSASYEDILQVIDEQWRKVDAEEHAVCTKLQEADEQRYQAELRAYEARKQMFPQHPAAAAALHMHAAPHASTCQPMLAAAPTSDAAVSMTAASSTAPALAKTMTSADDEAAALVAATSHAADNCDTEIHPESFLNDFAMDESMDDASGQMSLAHAGSVQAGSMHDGAAVVQPVTGHS